MTHGTNPIHRVCLFFEQGYSGHTLCAAPILPGYFLAAALTALTAFAVLASEA
jgi:hypothetical protein